MPSKPQRGLRRVDPRASRQIRVFVSRAAPWLIREDAVMERQGPRPQSEMDRALLRVVTEAYADLPAGAATLTQLWSDPADMWFVEIEPRNRSAARLSIAFDGTDLLNFTVGNIWFEIFPIRSIEDLTQTGDIARAVFSGRVEESGFPGDAFGRILLDDGTISAGRISLPWPWKLRPFKRRYEPYR